MKIIVQIAHQDFLIEDIETAQKLVTLLIKSKEVDTRHIGKGRERVIILNEKNINIGMDISDDKVISREEYEIELAKEKEINNAEK